jgi:hypothetical protein
VVGGSQAVAAPTRGVPELAHGRQRLRPHADAAGASAEAAALHAAQPREEARGAPAGLPIQTDVLACAALCALGAALGVVVLLGELRYHIISPVRCPAYTLAALCVGVVLGLWIPRRVIRQRLARGPGGVVQRVPSHLAETRGLRLEFAASLTGVLVLVFAVTWVGLCGGAVLMETYRAFLVRGFAHPPWLAQVLLAGPALAGLVVAGASGTTLLVALHGWYRLVTQPKTRIAWLWASILLGTLAAGVLAAQVASRAALAGLAPLTVFLAGVVAVLRRSDAVGPATPPPTRHRLTRDEALSLLIAALAAALVAGALVLAVPPSGVIWGRLPVGVVALAGATGSGLFAARLVARCPAALSTGAGDLFQRRAGPADDSHRLRGRVRRADRTAGRAGAAQHTVLALVGRTSGRRRPGADAAAAVVRSGGR